MKQKRVLILTGGTISVDFAKKFLENQEFDTIIAADSGLKSVEALNLPVDYILGDFDSVPSDILEKYRTCAKEKQQITMKEYNPEKDETDTQIAITLATELEADEIVILGATGTRIDHLLANIHLLYIPLKQNRKACIIDEHNKVYLINQNTTLSKDKIYGPYLSLLPLTETVKHVTLEGFKYPLTKRTLHIGESIGISNEVVSSKANILLESGILIVVESKD